MNSSNTKKLFESFPKLYAGRDKPITQSLMPFGFECGDGWFDLIYNLSECISSYVESNNVAPVEVIQVKEKYGSLRFYYNGGNDIVMGMVWLAEWLSQVTCEICGAKGEIDESASWYRCRCEKHLEN